jgi:homoserine kinase type II
VFTRPGADDHKVALDLDRVTEMLAAYREENAPTAAEIEALPLLLEVKRLKRGLGRRLRLADGEALSANDHAKIRLEDARLGWLDQHRDDLAAVVRRALG